MFQNVEKFFAKTITLVSIFFFLIAQYGCMGQTIVLPEHRQYSGEELERIKDQIGRMGVVSSEFSPELYPGKGVPRAGRTGLLAGALTLGLIAGAAHSRAESLGGTGWQNFERGLGYEILAIATAVSAVVILGMSLDPEFAEPSKDAMAANDVLARSDIQDRLRKKLVALAKEKKKSSMKSFPGEGPESATLNKDYKHLATERIDTVLELSVLQVGLKMAEDGAAHDEFFLTLRVRLINVMDNNVFYENYEVYRSSKDHQRADSGTDKNEYTLKEWISNDAKLLKEETEMAITHLAKQVKSHIL